MSVAIIDYEAGNVGSIKYAMLQCGFQDCYVAYEPSDLENAEKIILPGVGSFFQAMRVLRERELDIAIKRVVLENKIPLLGICLGMQVLASKGYEGGVVDGLNLIPGEVDLLKENQSDIRFPHVGWNEANVAKESALFDNIAPKSDFYFLHSYHFTPYDKQHVLATTVYGETFTSAVINNHILGVQFHPEKSGKLGRQLLKNFLML